MRLKKKKILRKNQRTSIFQSLIASHVLLTHKAQALNLKHSRLCNVIRKWIVGEQRFSFAGNIIIMKYRFASLIELLIS